MLTLSIHILLLFPLFSLFNLRYSKNLLCPLTYPYYFHFSPWLLCAFHNTRIVIMLGSRVAESRILFPRPSVSELCSIHFNSVRRVKGDFNYEEALLVIIDW